MANCPSEAVFQVSVVQLDPHRERFSATVDFPCLGLQMCAAHDSRVWKRPHAPQHGREEPENAPSQVDH